VKREEKEKEIMRVAININKKGENSFYDERQWEKG